MEEEKIMKIEDLGYDEIFETHRKRLGWENFELARVIAEHREMYRVKNLKAEYLAKITGKQIFEATSREDYPAVGDWVVIKELEEGEAMIQGILPRKTIIKRKYNGKNETQIIATNIDTAFIIESVDRDFNLNRLERYFAITSDSEIESAIVLNKTDLISKDDLELKLTKLKERFKNVDIILTSIINNKGLDELKEYIKKGKTYCFLGSSGVGKSSLINSLLGEEKIKTREIGTQSNRGKHTTTAREMYFLFQGGIVIDNPGLREVGMADVSEGVDKFFDEITVLSQGCKYRDCTHIHESGCEVLSALKAGKLDKGKYLNYINLKKESIYYEMTEVEKRDKDRKFGKFFKNAKKDFKNFGHKDY